MQSRPTYQLYSALLQVEIFGQYRFDISDVRVPIHGLRELYDAAELVASAVVCICKSKLRVVLGRHVHQDYRSGLSGSVSHASFPVPLGKTPHKWGQ